jgi:PPK2 family polyphosphate:nucleotide phosphotransferase
MINDKHIIATPGEKIRLEDYDTAYRSHSLTKEYAEEHFKEKRDKLKEMQDKLYASDKYAVLLIFQAMDAAGKDSTIRYVMSGVNPQGCQVFSFKQPSSEELDHDFLWRTYKALPERGRIGIFNRSYYEEVLVTKVHPKYIVNQRIPGINSLEDIPEELWQNRYQSINAMERHLVKSGTIILKFFLHVSKEEQRERFLKRINRPDKNWKFSQSDVEERKYWDEYQQAYEEAINATSTEAAPWYIIPADRKWFMRYTVGTIITQKMETLNLKYPQVSEKQIEELGKAKKQLEEEEK